EGVTMIFVLAALNPKYSGAYASDFSHRIPLAIKESTDWLDVELNEVQVKVTFTNSFDIMPTGNSLMIFMIAPNRLPITADAFSDKVRQHLVAGGIDGGDLKVTTGFLRN